MRTFKDEIEHKSSRFIKRRISIGDKEVMVLDGLFERKTVALLYQFMRSRQYHWSAVDSKHYSHSIRWKGHLLLTEAQKLPFFSDVATIVRGLSNDSRLELARVYGNFNLYGEVHYPHIDARQGITALYCANQQWDADWQGETVFFDKNEPAYVVLPRPGRLILFDAGLMHRGSPPARECFEPRMNIAFKFERRRKSTDASRKPGSRAPTYHVVRRRAR